MHLDITLRHEVDEGTAERFRRVEFTLGKILEQLSRMEEYMTTTLDDILADTTAESTAIGSLVTLTSGIKKQLDEALSGQTLSPAAQAKVNAIFANIQKNEQAVADAIAANTPVVVPPPSSVASSVTVVSSVNPSALGASVTFTAQVTGSDGGPVTDGTVSITDGGAEIKNAVVSSTGEVSFISTTLTVGDHAIAAVYAGGTKYAGSTSATLTQTVTAA